MRIQHNIMAMNAYRNYNTNTSALSKNLEKLSSGYKINRAGDDAAGLAISEKMRAQITGLNAAQKNVKDGISLVKTAEGAMQEIQDMLNRMDYLATQSANGTYQDEVDRENLQLEVDALKDEINRIADSANFNGIKLLDGSLNHVAGTDATTKNVTIPGQNIKGIDRILTTVYDPKTDGIEPGAVGDKTILDTKVAAATTGAFKLDLSGLDFSKNRATATVTVGFTLKIGGKATIAVSATIAGSATAATVKSDMLTAISKAIRGTLGSGSTVGTVSFNGVDWTISSSGGVFTFTMKEPPEKVEQAQLDFTVTVASWSGTASNVSIYDNHLGGTQPTKEAVAKEGAYKANTVFKLKQSDFVDGAQITIGGKTVTLKVGANGTAGGVTSGNIVDLSDMEYGNVDMDTALTRIGIKFGSASVTASLDGKVGQFKVGVSDDGTGLAVKRVGGSAAWTDLGKLASLFKITIKQTTMQVDVPAVAETGKGLTLQIGDTADKFNQLEVGIGDMHTDAMGAGKDADGNPSTDTIAGINVGTQEGAQKAVAVIKNAINYVSSVRGTLGATQNRLEHTANNLSVMAENIQDAESTIRDTDVAEEMMAYTKNNILIQSAQAMLAQANAVPQGVLQLLG